MIAFDSLALSRRDPGRERRILEQVGGLMQRRRLLAVVGSVDGLDDRALLARLSEPVCMTEFVRRHQTRLFGLAAAILNDRADAEEVVQDTFLQAFRSADTFRGEAQVSTWLHTICYRQALSRRRRRRHPTVGDEHLLTQPAEHHDTLTSMALAAAVERLPANNREAFMLVDVLGFSRTEAAAIAGIEDNTMRARVARAHMLLADLLDAARDQGDQS
ncbi:MAG: sigma-70 family RNA polymerase sigma factor [Actinomycetota bacterium]|nr:sigma-70 family RNA polymerase sigma factor [Actinomycetota bacterium]